MLAEIRRSVESEVERRVNEALGGITFTSAVDDTRKTAGVRSGKPLTEEKFSETDVQDSEGFDEQAGFEEEDYETASDDFDILLSGDEAEQEEENERENERENEDDLFGELLGDMAEDEEENEEIESMDEDEDEEEEEATDGALDGVIDIMSILTAEAEKLGTTSNIEQMELYDEMVIDITIEDLTLYIKNKSAVM